MILLAGLAGIGKMLLTQQEVQFFGKYGFSDPILMAFGLLQIIGALLLVFTRTRFAGAVIVALTFLVSLALIIFEGNVPMGIITFVAILLLGVIMRHARSHRD